MLFKVAFVECRVALFVAITIVIIVVDREGSDTVFPDLGVEVRSVISGSSGVP